MSTVHAIKTVRDLLLFRLDRRRILVVTCDAAGAIGPKRLDRVRVDGRTVGRFTARVALMEALSAGADPLCLINTLPVEQKPLGEEIVEGAQAELNYAHLDPRIATLQSSEKNFPVSQTGVGVTVIALASSKSLRIGLCKSGDEVVAIGWPLSGKEVLQGEKSMKIADTRDVRRLLRLGFVHSVIPVGSKGILYEARTLARESNLKLNLHHKIRIDVKKSAGPATVALCACPSSQSHRLVDLLNKPATSIGTLD